jgi:3',5'-cyclic AMP phosphodiesterase CpdA
MRVIAHLSDLHFGRTDPTMVAALQEAVAGLAPNIVVVSGDLTQRARVREFVEARAFLDSIPASYLAVPGNHDIRLYDLYGRFVRPLQTYRRYISEDVEPVYSDPELRIVSLNTARSLTFKGGRINTEQIRRVTREYAEAPAGAVKVLVAHHPLDLPETLRHPLAGRARMAMAALGGLGIDLILSGHLHLPYMPDPVDQLRVGGHSALLIQAGTAVSTRSRGQVNSFNSISTGPDRITVTQHCWSTRNKMFEQGSPAVYWRVPSGWARKERSD